MEVLLDPGLLLALVPILLGLVAAIKTKNVLGVCLYAGQLLEVVAKVLVKLGKPKDQPTPEAK